MLALLKTHSYQEGPITNSAQERRCQGPQNPLDLHFGYLLSGFVVKNMLHGD